MPPSACILACSPRVNGNTDRAAECLAQSFQDGTPQIVRLADLWISPCISCGRCLDCPGMCPLSSANALPRQKKCPSSLSGADQALDILQAFSASGAPCFISPIYFYHLPAQAKALIDRCQAFWAMPTKDKPGQGRKMGIILLGARPKGAELFAGAMLTLRYAALCLGLRLAEPLLLYGLENTGDLAARPDLLAEISAYGQRLRP